MRRIDVSREKGGQVERVGVLVQEDDETHFSYSEAYRARDDASEISLSLPLESSQPQSGVFFENLVPEGERRRMYSSAFHVNTSDWAGVLSKLGNESIGALLLTEDEEVPSLQQEGASLTEKDFETFTLNPKRTALRLGMTARLSLAGAQTKLGLRNTSGTWDEGWEIPVGFSASTHILKADDGTFPDQIANEALCMDAARRCELDVAETKVLTFDGVSLLAVKRFDRPIGSNGSVTRLHQEDFCQAKGLSSGMKYEPTDGHYANMCSHLISRASNNPFGDRIAFFESLLFDYLIGNCDNHLKNKSFLWNADWSGRDLAPLYDVSCTTVYPELDREMGIGLSKERVIESVTISSIAETAKSAGVPESMAINMLKELQEKLPYALADAIAELDSETSGSVAGIGNKILDDVRARCAMR